MDTLKHYFQALNYHGLGHDSDARNLRFRSLKQISNRRFSNVITVRAYLVHRPIRDIREVSGVSDLELYPGGQPSIHGLLSAHLRSIDFAGGVPMMGSNSGAKVE